MIRIHTYIYINLFLDFDDYGVEFLLVGINSRGPDIIIYIFGGIYEFDVCVPCSEPSVFYRVVSLVGLLAFVYPKKTALKKDRPLGNVKGTE